MEIPQSMVEAAARTLCASAGRDWDFPGAGVSSTAQVERFQAGYRDRARDTLAAALGVCEVREEEGGRCARDGDVFGHPGDWWSARSWLATRSHSQPDAHLIRRLVITTPAEPVSEPEESSHGVA